MMSAIATILLMPIIVPCFALGFLCTVAQAAYQAGRRWYVEWTS